MEKFGLQMGNTDQFFLTEVDDPQGNAVEIQYDAQMRIVAVVDALGQATTFCYSDSSATNANCQPPQASAAPSSNLEVTQVVDPFGRSAFFGYAPTATTVGTYGAIVGNHLVSITDVLGIKSQFAYAANTDGSSSDFIATLTTPYGVTSFSFSEDDSTPSSGERTVTAVDPLGRTSYVASHQGQADSQCSSTNAVSIGAATADGNHIECTPSVWPATMIVAHSNLQYRNTFIWDPYQYCASGFGAAGSTCATYATPDCTSAPYNCAKLIHWLHSDTTRTRTRAPAR